MWSQLDDRFDLPVLVSGLPFCQHFSSMLNLQTLIANLSVFDAHTLEILGSLPHLHTMEIYDMSRVPLMIPAVDLSDHSFPELRKLSLAVLDLGEFEDIWGIRQLISRPTEVKISFTELELEGDAEVLMNNICSYSPQIIDLTLEFTPSGEALPQYLLQSLEYLQSLEKLSILGTRPASSSATCEVLSVACPSLRELSIPDLQVSIPDLRHFAQLGQLENLCIHVDWETYSRLGEVVPEVFYASHALRDLNGCWASHGIEQLTLIEKAVQYVLTPLTASLLINSATLAFYSNFGPSSNQSRIRSRSQTRRTMRIPRRVALANFCALNETTGCVAPLLKRNF